MNMCMGGGGLVSGRGTTPGNAKPARQSLFALSCHLRTLVCIVQNHWMLVSNITCYSYGSTDSIDKNIHVHNPIPTSFLSYGKAFSLIQ